MKKLLFAAAAVVVVGAVALPLSNLLIPREVDPALTAQVSDPALAAALPVLAGSCTDCHTDATNPPLYMKLPVARTIIANDIRTARASFDMERELFAGGQGPSQAALAKVQQVVDDDAMPPTKYTMMHWNARLDDGDRGTLADWIHTTRARLNGGGEPADPRFARAVLPLEQVTGLDPARVELGRILYHDVRLSGDDSISCASCHDLAKGGTDQAPVSTGVGGQLGPINAPTTLNAVFNLAQFWDGRAPDLAAQADGPPNNPGEMASNWDEILGKLRKDETLVAAFQSTYGELNDQTVRDAIATFEATLVTVDSPFDRFLRGEETALSAEQQAGWRLFDAHGCDTCHAGPAMGGTSYELMGVHGDYFTARGGEMTKADLGRFNVSGDEVDRHRFKVPTLRNVALTFPYFHDGSVATLEEAVRKMAVYERGVPLDDGEIQQVVAFLEGLTGTLGGKPL